MEVTFKKFEELSNVEWYKIAQLRQQVFMLEQKIHYLDFDGKDLQCYHAIGKMENEIVSYCRIIPKGIDGSSNVSFGRVLVAEKYRKKNFGKLLMEETIRFCTNNLKENEIKISAQIGVEKFYQQLGFTTIGKTYLEAGIEHVGMLYTTDLL